MTARVVLARLVLGLTFLVFGLNGFLGFTEPPPMNQRALDFLGALMATGYVMPLVKAIETVAGAMLISGRAVPLALTLLAPILVNITLLHLVLDRRLLPLAVVLLALALDLAWSYRAAFGGLLIAHAPTSVAASESRADDDVATEIAPGNDSRDHAV